MIRDGDNGMALDSCDFGVGGWCFEMRLGNVFLWACMHSAGDSCFLFMYRNYCLGLGFPLSQKGEVSPDP
jgi:hypothetical protein